MVEREATTKRMGALLAEGWSMLARSCPDCSVPIMRSRDQSKEICCTCDWYRLGGQYGKTVDSKPDEKESKKETCGYTLFPETDEYSGGLDQLRRGEHASRRDSEEMQAESGGVASNAEAESEDDEEEFVMPALTEERR